MLVVKFQDGTVVFDNVAADTFVKVVEKLGIERVKALDLRVNNFPLISKQKSENYTQSPSGAYLVMTHSNTETKRSLLLKIADGLNEHLAVEVVPAPSVDA